MPEIGEYRQRLQTVEAVKFDGTEQEMMEAVAWVQSHGYAYYDLFTPAPPKGVSINPDTGFLSIVTNGRATSAQKGYYLVRGYDGLVTAMSESDFHAMYEVAGEQPTPKDDEDDGGFADGVVPEVPDVEFPSIPNME